MTTTIKVEIEIKKTVPVVIRKRPNDTSPWDWYVEAQAGQAARESTDYYATIEEAIADAEKALG